MTDSARSAAAIAIHTQHEDAQLTGASALYEASIICARLAAEHLTNGDMERATTWALAYKEIELRIRRMHARDKPARTTRSRTV